MFDYSIFQLVFWLIVAHALCDYPLQGYLALAKRHVPTAEADNGNRWPWALFYHGMIHGGGVAYVTGSILLGCAEVVVHIITDFLKNDGKIGYHADQVIHIGFKLLWAAVTVSMTA